MHVTAGGTTESEPEHGAPHPADTSSSVWGRLPASAYRSRRAALTDPQREAWDRLWPRLGTQAIEPGESDGQPQPLNTAEWFGREAPLVLEIGCGNGASTLAMAAEEPDIDVIAVEIYRRGLAQLVCSIDKTGVDNIRLVRGNALDVLQHLLPSDSLTGVRVFFPDPWPKSRHHKRRLLQPSTFAMIADRLRPGGVIHAATDHAGYAEQIAAAGDAEPLLDRVTAQARLPISVVRPTTKYESKAHRAGSAVSEMIWIKNTGMRA